MYVGVSFYPYRIRFFSFSFARIQYNENTQLKACTRFDYPIRLNLVYLFASGPDFTILTPFVLGTNLVVFFFFVKNYLKNVNEENCSYNTAGRRVALLTLKLGIQRGF